MKLHIHTPLIESPEISKITGKKVYLKLENTQPSGSFKIRGIGLLCQRAVEEGKTQFISSSGGNAGYAAAYAGKMLGIKTTVFVPTTTPQETIAKIEQLNAEVNISGNVWDETDKFARKFAEQINGLYISPFDHSVIWEGHATIVDEIAEEIEKPDAIILSVGGGGLLCGVVEGLHRNNWQDVPVIAVETYGSASFHEAQKAGKLVTLDKIDTIAKSLGAKTVSTQTLEWNKKHEIKSILVSDEQTVDACINFANHHRFLVEPACGASLAIAYDQHEVLKNAKTIVIIVCGGIGVDLAKLKNN
ncbi:MAG: pyridoxal-phosphate dependent enzyme [Bacteroidales bacterium]|nr:pyridoxal-phosphate dependent enzyme [Bacteroidales bacterium]